jgi:hypothetical protein
MKQTLRGPGIRIELDSDEINHDDPGAGTPAMVYVGRETGTYWCMVETGETLGGTMLTKRQNQWLEDQRHLVDKFMEENG